MYMYVKIMNFTFGTFEINWKYTGNWHINLKVVYLIL